MSAGEPTPLGLAASSPLYDRLAADYDEHFRAPHRAAYDLLAWELAAKLLPPEPGVVVDVGCGVGRWAERLVAQGHEVIGIEPAPEMAAAARCRLPATARIIEEPMETAEVAPAAANLVLAMGSLQYAQNPAEMLQTFAGWLRPGGWVAVVVDSYVALIQELFARGREEEALLRMRTRRGRWVQHDLSAEMHLFDAQTLERDLVRAGLVEVEVRGLLVGWSLLGGDEVLRRLGAGTHRDRAHHLDTERQLSAEPGLRDLGKQLLAAGRVPDV